MVRILVLWDGNVDMALGSEVEGILEQQLEASCGRFRGVRISSGWDAHAKIPNVAPHAGLLIQAG